VTEPLVLQHHRVICVLVLEIMPIASLLIYLYILQKISKF